MSLFGARNADHDTSNAKNWTPALLATLAIARSTEGVKDKLRQKADRLLRDNRLSKDELLGTLLYARGVLRFGHDEVIKFFGDNYKFEKVQGAILDAMNLLCMRFHLENPGNTGTANITDAGRKKINLVLQKRTEIQKHFKHAA